MKESQLTPDSLYLLWCIYVGEKPQYINVYTQSRSLILGRYLDSDLKITEAGVELASKIPVSKNTPKKVSPSFVLTNAHIDEYLQLFPKGKLPSGKLARSDKQNIKANFDWFMKNYNYSWDTIIRATALYVDEYEKKNFLYMKTSQYFISKMSPDKSRVSELADYCSAVVNNDYENDDNHFTEKVV
ncbi:MAG: hypothetical protein EBU90_26190 [Proteobacteria bacterium]|jgi:hypothetical protein|nr:hypothetical protein [Pseudomonadota bacterium]NBP13652.1 hypothetical protein [bacterium]